MDKYWKGNMVEKIYVEDGLYIPRTESFEGENPLDFKDDGVMAGYRTYVEENWSFDSGNWIHSTSNYTQWIWFGKRYTYDEVVELARKLPLRDRVREAYINVAAMRTVIPSYREILTYMRKNNLSEICLDRYRGYHNLEDNNLVYEELQAERAAGGSPIVRKRY